MPDFEIEDSLNCMVAGVDEAGRGPWAGPVVAGAVIIRDRNLGDELLKGLDDSKKISAKKRELLYEKLREEEKNGRLFIGIGQASAEEIDRCNILQATFAAMKRAVEALKEKRQSDAEGFSLPYPNRCQGRRALYVNCRSVNCGQGLPGSSDAGAGTEIPLLCF